jgi:hypothetical protein
MTVRAEHPAQAGQLDVVKLCWEYGVLHTNHQVGRRLSPAERRTLSGLVRLLEGDPFRRRRRHRRLPLMLPVVVGISEGQVEGLALNLSGGGAYAICPSSVPAGSSVTVAFRHPDAAEHRWNGIVRWARPRGSQWGLGIRFSSFPLMQRATALWEIDPALSVAG